MNKTIGYVVNDTSVGGIVVKTIFENRNWKVQASKKDKFLLFTSNRKQIVRHFSLYRQVFELALNTEIPYYIRQKAFSYFKNPR